jgi:SAM-dependent methyltransferase
MTTLSPTQTALACPACNDTRSSHVTTSILEGEMVRCQTCGLIYITPEWTQEAIMRTIAKYNGFPGSVAEGVSDRMPSMRRVAAVLAKHSPAGKLLDIGCAGGIFFQAMRETAPQWSLFGAEPDLAWQQYDYQGAEVRFKQLAECGFAEATFDAISVLDAVYYMPHLGQELANIRRLLKPGGLFVVDIPTLGYLKLRGTFGKLLGMAHTITYASYPLYFSDDSMRRFLGKAGFRVLSALPDQGIAHSNPAFNLGLGLYTQITSVVAKQMAPKTIYVAEAV